MALNSFFEYKWKYLWARFIKRFLAIKSKNHDYLFIVHDESRNWILGSKARRLQSNNGLAGEVIYSNRFKNLPDAEGYFFLHQKYFARSIRYNPHLLNRKLIIMFTHPEWNKWYSAEHMGYVLNFAHKIICLNSAVKNELQQIGIPKEKIEMYHLASDPFMFQPKERKGEGAVGLSMAFGPRKNPDMVVKLIKMMPHRNFILIGPRWQEFLEKEGVASLPNFTYYSEPEYEKYPELYHKMDVLVSTSILEGGPVPLLEAMLCNVVPVASNTGYCPDIIRHGENGYLFNTNAKVEEIMKLIDQAFLLKTNVREGIEIHSWENYKKKIADLFHSIK